MTLAIIGVGNVGSALGERLTASEYDVVFGTRPGKNIDDLLTTCGPRARAASIAEACAAAEVIFLAVPAAAAVEALRGVELAGKVVVDCNNPMTWQEGPVWAPPAEGSVTAQLAAAYPEAHHVKGFSTFGAELHRNPGLSGGPVDVQMAGDDAGAKEKVARIARRAGFHPVDSGPLRNAAVLENLAILWIHLALIEGHGRDIGFRLVGRGE